MKILIITTKWAAGTIENVHCSTHRAFVRPAQLLFENNPDIQLEIDYIEKNNIWSEKALDERLLRDDFDICLVTPHKSIVPKLSTAKKLGKKLFICVLDSLNNSTSNRAVNLRIFLKNLYDNGVVKFENSMLDFSEFCNVLIFDNGFDEVFPNIYGVFEPIDTSVLYPIPENEKEIELGFIGSMYEAERKWYVESLLRNKFPLTLLGGKGENEQKLSYEDWAEANRHIKISLNFNGNYFLGARKGRVWEIASCNNLMIATLPEVYKYSKGTWFKDGEHFISIDQNNYLEKINFYLNNPAERIAIAKNMHDFWKKNYTSEIWWNNIFRWSKNA